MVSPRYNGHSVATGLLLKLKDSYHHNGIRGSVVPSLCFLLGMFSSKQLNYTDTELTQLLDATKVSSAKILNTKQFKFAKVYFTKCIFVVNLPKFFSQNTLFNTKQFKFTKVCFTKCVFVVNSPEFAPTKVFLYTVSLWQEVL